MVVTISIAHHSVGSRGIYRTQQGRSGLGFFRFKFKGSLCGVEGCLNRTAVEVISSGAKTDFQQFARTGLDVSGSMLATVIAAEECHWNG